MDEQDWLVSANPTAMLYVVADPRLVGEDQENILACRFPRQATDRQLRLFESAVESTWWGPYAGPREKESLLLMDAFADGKIPFPFDGDTDFTKTSEFSYTVHRDAATSAFQCVRIHNSTGDPPLWANLLREIVGNPWRPIRLERGCEMCGGTGEVEHHSGSGSQKCPMGYDDSTDKLFWVGCKTPESWLTSTVTALAQKIYDERDFGLMPMLADALEEAGCDEAAILNHCREDGTGAPHIRGCWVLDLLLERR